MGRDRSRNTVDIACRECGGPVGLRRSPFCSDRCRRRERRAAIRRQRQLHEQVARNVADFVALRAVILGMFFLPDD